MRWLIAEIAYLLGYRTWYLVTFSWPNANGSTSTANMTLFIRPWLRKDKGIVALREFLKDKAGSDVTPNIISIVKIGV